MTNKQVSAAVRHIPFGAELPDDIKIGLSKIVASQVKRYDMTAKQKAKRKLKLQRETGVRS